MFLAVDPYFYARDFVHLFFAAASVCCFIAHYPASLVYYGLAILPLIGGTSTGVKFIFCLHTHSPNISSGRYLEFRKVLLGVML